MAETWWLLSMAANLRLEDWQRVGYLGQAKATTTGHAPMGVGEVKRVLLAPDTETGEVRKAASVNVSRAISMAVERGMLGEDSCARCLVLPNRIENGSRRWGITRNNGPVLTVCPVHGVR